LNRAICRTVGKNLKNAGLRPRARGRGGLTENAANLSSEAKYNAPADENIVLTALVRSHIQVWDTRPEVSGLTAEPEVPD
jgi:hypothetical protein